MRPTARKPSRRRAWPTAQGQGAAERPGFGRGEPRHADDGAVYRDQGGQSGLPPVLPDGRLLRAVLRRRGDREPGARHRADQARQAHGRRHPDVRRAGRARRRLSPAADRARPPRRRLRADRGPGGGQEARREIGRAARRRAARHPRHDHRGRAARARPGQLCWRSRARAPSDDGAGLRRSPRSISRPGASVSRDATAAASPPKSPASSRARSSCRTRSTTTRTCAQLWRETRPR